MDLFWILLLVQLLGLIAVGIMLRRNLPASIDTIINKNSTRSDGSFSKGRFQQEKESINRWLKCVDGGLVFIFLATTFSAMITADFEVPLLNVGGLLWEKDPTVFIEPSSEMPFPEMQWPLVAVYAVSSFLLAPTVILPLYYKSLQNYRARANARFLDYYRQGFEQAREPPSVAN